MNIRILTVSRRQPAWVNDGYETYARRLKGGVALQLVEIAPADRHGVNSAEQVLQCKAQEAARINAQRRERETRVALDEHADPLSTSGLADFLRRCQYDANPPAFIVGGADGLHPDVIANAHACFSLSALTLPHGMVRVVLAEALYRAWSLLHNHPYHRV